MAGYVTHSLQLTHLSSYSIKCFSDIAWESNLHDWKSTTCYCVFLDNNIIYWNSISKKLFLLAVWGKILEYCCRVYWNYMDFVFFTWTSSSFCCFNYLRHFISCKFCYVFLLLIFQAWLILMFVMESNIKLILFTHKTDIQVTNILTKPLFNASFIKFRHKLEVKYNSTISLKSMFVNKQL